MIRLVWIVGIVGLFAMLVWAEEPPARKDKDKDKDGPKGLPAPEVKIAPPELPPTQFPDLKPGTAIDPEAKRPYAIVPDPPALPAAADTDSAVVKLAKARMRAISDARRALAEEKGRDPMAFDTRLAAALAAAADDAIPSEKERRPWYEFRVRALKAKEQYYFVRATVVRIDPPHLLPAASAERLEAEVALLKLNEKLGK